MELLSEVRTPAQVLNFALYRERVQENQKEILRSSAPIGTIKSTQLTTTHGPHNVPKNNEANIQPKQTNNAGDVEEISQ